MAAPTRPAHGRGAPRPSRRRAAAAAAAAAPAPRVAVLGGGVVGLSAAVRVLDRLPAARLTIVAEEVAAGTTSVGAAGLWKPFAVGAAESAERINRWGAETFQHYLNVYHSPAAAAAGVLLTPAYELFPAEVPDPAWAPVVLGFRRLAPAEIAALDPRPAAERAAWGWSYTTTVAEGSLYLQWLLDAAVARGAAVERCRVGALSELGAEFDAVVNATGLGAAHLTDVLDAELVPIRGHVLRVRAPWVRHHVEAAGAAADRPAYIIPNADAVVLGGTKDKGCWDRTPCAEERAAILARCAAVVPSLAGAEVVGEWVGLRPGRPTVRLELAREPVAGRAAPRPVVQCFGHGGSGLTLGWGCAGDVAELLAEALGE
jgi:glycine/D-amino acid oxidase-like deaminating enzyme